MKPYVNFDMQMDQWLTKKKPQELEMKVFCILRCLFVRHKELELLCAAEQGFVSYLVSAIRFFCFSRKT